jgi:tetratricopeptide (TPR) repeat protein
MRLYLGRVIDEADNGRSVVSDRTGLPETKLDALEAAPLNLEQVGDEFDPIAKEAAAEIGAIPLESLTNWRDVRLWAKAKLSDKDWNSAMKGYQKAIEIVPNDAESRLGYAAALSAKGSKKDIILRHLEAAHDCLMPKSPRDLRKNVFKSLIYQFLYLKRPESFLGALNYAREYFTHPDAVESGGIWINIACAYGQAYSWVSESEKNVLEYEKMLVKPNQSKPSEGTGETAQQRALQWLNEQALIAVKQAISRDRAWKEKVAMLMGIKPQEPPPKSPEDADLDLAPFSKDTAFLAVINNGTAVRAM